MIPVELREQIRRAYFIEHKSKRQIAREFNVARMTVDKLLESDTTAAYRFAQPRNAPKLGPYKKRIDELLDENPQLPPKQHWIARTIFKQIRGEGYSGAEPTVRAYIALRRHELKRPEVFLPLEYDPGKDAQVDWGEADVILGGKQITVQLFVMRLCYSRKIFVMTFPTQQQECFFAAHVAAFHFFNGVPHRLTYDNLTTAVKRVLEGRNRQEQEAFILFRSHYLFGSHFCTPGQGHEKGGVEHGVGYARRNFLVPLPRVDSFEALNTSLLKMCNDDDARCPARQSQTIAETFAREQLSLRPFPPHDFACCKTLSAALNPYSQVTFETNRYSVPVEQAKATLILKAYPFHLDILDGEKRIAQHPRCYDRQQDIFDPQHYLALLEQRPGAFEHARPLRQWREKWSPIYEQLLAQLRARQPEGQGVRDFIHVLRWHQQHPASLIEQAITQALALGCIHPDGIALCLRQLTQPETTTPSLPLQHQPRLNDIGEQPLNLQRYNTLLTPQENS